MFIPSEFAKKTIKALNADVRYFSCAQSFIMKNDKLVMDPDRAGKTYCEVKDKETGEWYCQADGPDESVALDNALRKALVTEKPMTKAQKASKAVVEEVVRVKDTELEAQRLEIEQLKAEIASNQVKFSNKKNPMAASA